MRRPSSTNKRAEMEIGDQRFQVLLLKIWKMEAIYKTDKMKYSMDSQPMPTSALKKEEMKLFQTYWGFILIK